MSLDIEGIATCRKDLTFATDLQTTALQIGHKIAEHQGLSDFDRQILLASMGAIQDDAAEEFDMALNLLGISQADLHEADPDTQLRALGFLLVANIFNTGDSLLECYIGVNGLPGDNPIDPDVIKEVELYSHDGVYYNTKDTLQLLENLVENRVPRITNTVDAIIEANLRGIGMLGEGEYSLADALEYRQGTIGAYADLLGDIFFVNDDFRLNFRRSMMEAQFLDDISDVYEDMIEKPQVNPLVAVARQHGLVDFTQSHQGLLELYWAASNEMDLDDFELPTHFNPVQFQQDVDFVRTSYQIQ